MLLNILVPGMSIAASDDETVSGQALKKNDIE